MLKRNPSPQIDFHNPEYKKSDEQKEWDKKGWDRWAKFGDATAFFECNEKDVLKIRPTQRDFTWTNLVTRKPQLCNHENEPQTLNPKP